jgi:hypothetical protein
MTAGIRRITNATPPYDVYVAFLECTSGMFHVCRSLVPVRDKALESTIDPHRLKRRRQHSGFTRWGCTP